MLQVHPEADPRVIDAAFGVLREMACRDLSPEGLRRLVALNAAHRVLGDPGRRAAYDAARAR
jgi:curved DNA-binding protein CbpA